MRDQWTEQIGERIACAVVAALIGVFLCLAWSVVGYWFPALDLSRWRSLYILFSVPVVCGLAGFLFGDRALEPLKRLAGAVTAWFSGRWW